MKKIKLCTVIGARPQFIKAAALHHALKKYSGIEEILIHTGQHYDASMSDVFFSELEISKPHFHLDLGGGSHGEQTGKMLEKIEKIFLDVKPDWVLVYGDTNSTLAGALAAAKLHIPVAHVEAGLRSFNKKMPEELNRILTDHVSALLFAPTDTAVHNLRREGFASEQIVRTGDIMLDITQWMIERLKDRKSLVDTLNVRRKSYALATIHRAENTDDPSRLKNIMEALSSFSVQVPVVLPLHPRTQKKLKEMHLNVDAKGLRIIDPVGYADMTALLQSALLVTTDSGGLQKEAFFHRVPCVTLREETEWTELVEVGWNRLADPKSAEDLLRKMTETSKSEVPRQWPPLYGDGKTSEMIVEKLLNAQGISL